MDTSDFNKLIGIELRKLRRDNKRSQKEIANYLHISQSQYSKYERGEVNITLDYIVSLSAYYHISLDEIVYQRKPSRSYNYLKYVHHRLYLYEQLSKELPLYHDTLLFIGSAIEDYVSDMVNCLIDLYNGQKPLRSKEPLDLFTIMQSSDKDYVYKQYYYKGIFQSKALDFIRDLGFFIYSSYGSRFDSVVDLYKKNKDIFDLCINITDPINYIMVESPLYKDAFKYLLSHGLTEEVHSYVYYICSEIYKYKTTKGINTELEEELDPSSFATTILEIFKDIVSENPFYADQLDKDIDILSKTLDGANPQDMLENLLEDKHEKV